MPFVLRKVENYNHFSRLVRLSCSIHASLLAGLMITAGLSFNTAFANPLARDQGVFHQTLLQQRYLAHVDLGSYYFKQSSHKRGELSLFLPLYQDPYHLFYSDVRFYDHQGPSWEGNIAFGYRHLSHDNDKLWGIYSSFDRMRSRDENDFNQVTVGGEYWHSRWFVGGNVYLPIGREKYTDQAAQGVSLKQAGAYKHIYIGDGFEHSMHGFDAQIGNNLWRGLTVYIGGYYYQAPDVPKVWGPRVRAEYTWYQSSTHPLLGIINRISVQTQLQDDKARGFNCYGGLLFSINLLPTHHTILSGVSRHMVDGLRRDKDIVTSSFHDPLTLLTNGRGKALSIKDVYSKSAFESALKDKQADVIAIHGKIAGLSSEQLSRTMVITGGRYVFPHDGQHFTVNVSQGGFLQAARGKELLQVAGDHDIILQDLKLRVDANSGHKVIFNDPKSGSIGNLLVDDIVANGRVAIGLTGKGTIGRVSIINSYFNTGKWSPASANAALFFHVDDGAYLAIDRFSGNSIKTRGNYVSGIYSSLSGNNSRMVIDKLTDNIISTQGKSAVGIVNSLQNKAVLTVNHLSRNKIDTEEERASGIVNNVGTHGNLVIDKLTDNIITTQGSFAEGIFTLANIGGIVKITNFINNDVNVEGDSTFGIRNSVGGHNGLARLHIINFNNNDITITGASSGVINSVANGKLTIDNFVENTIRMNASNAVIGMENEAGSGTLTINHLFNNDFSKHRDNNIVLSVNSKIGHINITVGDSGKGLSDANFAGDSHPGVKTKGEKRNIHVVPGL